MQHFRKYLLLYTLLPLIVLMIVTSYYRFIVVQDYIVGYEGYCDPYEQSCFVYCEDEDDCPEPFFYSWIERNASTLYETCGALVTECEEAYSCEGDPTCSISYCELNTHEDETFFERLLFKFFNEKSDCDTLSSSDLSPFMEPNI